MLLLHQQGDEDGIVGSVSDTVALRVLQEFGPLLRIQQIGVVNVEERKELAGARPVLEKCRVLTVAEERALINRAEV